MGKYIKRFSTHAEHTAYLLDASLETPFVGICDEEVEYAEDDGEHAATIFVENSQICIKPASGYNSAVFVIDGSTNDASMYMFGNIPVSSLSKNISDTLTDSSENITDNNIYGDSTRTIVAPSNNNSGIRYLPYSPNYYYAFTIVHPFYGEEYGTKADQLIFSTTPAEIKYYYGEYTKAELGSDGDDPEDSYSWTPPYEISGFPDEYTGPLYEETNDSGESITANNGTVIDNGDPIYFPIKRAYKLLPGTTIYVFVSLE